MSVKAIDLKQIRDKVHAISTSALKAVNLLSDLSEVLRIMINKALEQEGLTYQDIKDG